MEIAAKNRRVDIALALGLGVAAVLAVTLTLRDVGLSYDEPENIEFQTRMRTWLGLLVRAGDGVTPRKALSSETFERYWSYETRRHLHPPMAGYLANMAWWAFHRWMGEPWSYRMASAILFGLLVALLYGEARAAWGRLSGVGAAAALVLMPRVFGHAHLAVTDTPAMVLWFVCWVTFRPVATGRPKGHVPWGRMVLFGAALGLSLLTRFTNWLVVVPLGLWAARFRWRIPWRWLWVAGAAALVAAVGLNPRWWRDPAGWIYLFVQASLTRGSYSTLPTYFLGRTYPFNLPWYNAPLLTAATTPVAILVLFAVGLAAACRDRLRTDLGAFAAMTVIFLWVARGLPQAPGHDGIRLFLPAFPLVAALAGGGLSALGRFCRRPRSAGAALLALMVLSAGYQLVRTHPYHLSYYSEIVGGPAGAQRLGLETTYWWDAATDEFLDLINDRSILPPNAQVYAIPGWPTLRYWQEVGRLRQDIVFVSEEEDFGKIEFLILLCRQGKFSRRGGEFDPGAPPPQRPPGYTEEALWRWYRTWDRQWGAFAPRHGVPLIVLVRHGAGGALLR